MKTQRPPREGLYRARPESPKWRDSDEDGPPILSGYFASFGEWTRIDSVFEGTFMERIEPGTFKKTFGENRDNIRCIFQHGRDFQVGDKPLGPYNVLEEREDDGLGGAYYEVPLLDTSYNRDLEPGLRAGVYGASFAFSVVREDFDRDPGESEHNPDGIPERRIREARVYEGGPVTYPAYAGATAGVRSVSLTDQVMLARAAQGNPERLHELADFFKREPDGEVKGRAQVSVDREISEQTEDTSVESEVVETEEVDAPPIPEADESHLEDEGSRAATTPKKDQNGWTFESETKGWHLP